MTDMPTPRRIRRRAVQAALALLVGLGLSTPALAFEPLAPTVKSRPLYKKYRDRDVTIIIIDKDDGRSTSSVPRADLKPLPGKNLLAPTSRIERDDDNTAIIIKRKRHASGQDRSGPKVIIVDRNSSGCGDSGVCVIRP